MSGGTIYRSETEVVSDIVESVEAVLLSIGEFKFITSAVEFKEVFVWDCSFSFCTKDFGSVVTRERERETKTVFSYEEVSQSSLQCAILLKLIATYVDLCMFFLLKRYSLRYYWMKIEDCHSY